MRLMMSIIIFLLTFMTISMPLGIALGTNSLAVILFFSIFASVLLTKKVMSLVR